MTLRNTTTRDRHRRIIARGHPPCHICGGDIDYHTSSHLDPVAFTVDHLIPLNKGGTDTLDNKAAAHRKCNRDKSDTVAGVTFVTARIW